ncbi:MAG: ATP-binding protein [SAR324 cluster bacterium]|nr:ATP-binding protein [SAR324 cluster bacterium]
MKVPFINTSEELDRAVDEAFRVTNQKHGEEKGAGGELLFYSVPLRNSKEGIDYINYQTPALIIINFSDGQIDGFAIMQQVVADPWLNHGGIIALYEDSSTLEKIDELNDTNIIISVAHYELKDLLARVLQVVRENQQILFQRAIHSGLMSNMSGKFFLAPDISIIPCYTNLIANYLYNLGLISPEDKQRVGLSLAELLINAIEHGTCGISYEEKSEFMEKHGAIHELIKQKCSDPKIAARTVTFQYEISPTESTYRIEDEGDGFDWRKYMNSEEPQDLLAFHGRGIMMTMNMVAKIGYNDKGNVVTIAISHQQNTSNTVPLVFQDQETVDFQPEDLVFKQGEESNFLYYIAEGEYRVEVDDKQVAIITPADILMGEMSFLLQEIRSANVIANTPGKLIKISNINFVNSIKEQPYFGLFLAKLLAQRLYNLARIK